MKTIGNIAASLLLVIAFDAAANTVERNRVVLKVTGDAPDEQLVVDKNDSDVKKCKKNQHDGCVEVGRGNTAEFTIKLKQGVNDCAGNDGQWALARVILGGEVSGDDPGSKPDQWGGLSAVAAADFGADATSGEVAVVNTGNDRFTFSNANSAEYSLWYTVLAELCGDGRTIELDPSITNKGK